jgi:hypothetical protein
MSVTVTRQYHDVVVKLILFLLLLLGGVSVQASVRGQIESIEPSGNGYNILGWACQTFNRTPINIKLYASGILIREAKANQSSGPATGLACRTVLSNHGFSIHLSNEEIARFSGQPIYIQGMALTRFVSHNFINGSGQRHIPRTGIRGDIEGIVDTGGRHYLRGWACDVAIHRPVTVQIYAGGPKGTGTLVKTHRTDMASDQAISDACGTKGIPHRFNIELTGDEIDRFPSEALYVHGVSESGGQNFAITRSGLFSFPESRFACRDADPLRRPFFGDLHVHTAISMDAASYGVRTRPADAYRFAKGHPINLPPYQRGIATRQMALSRPLDFAGVSDHAEYMAEANICYDTSSPGYLSPYCLFARGVGSNLVRAMDPISALIGFGQVQEADPEFKRTMCSNPLWRGLCRTRAEGAWNEINQAAQEHNDQCRFTTFHGYEWTGTPDWSNLHRNVFFRNEVVQKVPVSYFEAPHVEKLWARVDAECNKADNNCEALLIPHNPNLGGGKMFTAMRSDTGAPYDQSVAAQRARLEPLVEIYQHKGASECIRGPSNIPGFSNDQFCDFEQLYQRPICAEGEGWSRGGCIPLCRDFSLKLGGGMSAACVEPGDFVRNSLRQGLELQSSLGINPFQFGIIGSTDTHSSTPGATGEDRWFGAMGERDADLEGIVSAKDQGILVDIAKQLVPGVEAGIGFLTNLSAYSAGGLAVVWAEENTRDSLFEAMKRREAYGTSGSRIILRTFMGDHIPDNICQSPDLARVGYTSGVPMGGELPPDSRAPKMVVSAMADSRPGAAPLQRLQIIKGWVDVHGQSHEQVFDVAGDIRDYGEDPGVDLDSCALTRAGYNSMCQVWQDPDFDPSVDAFYYARVLENHSCRYTRRLCNEALENYAHEHGLSVWVARQNPPEHLAACYDGSISDTVQERAWSSPTWHNPIR